MTHIQSCSYDSFPNSLKKDCITGIALRIDAIVLSQDLPTWHDNSEYKSRKLSREAEASDEFPPCARVCGDREHLVQEMMFERVPQGASITRGTATGSRDLGPVCRETLIRLLQFAEGRGAP